MAATGLLALLDDISNILDDVALLTKVATRKTAGVLGDDLALNAQQVAGVRADRELPVVWAVAKGSALNKAILVPAALAISAILPWAVTPLLMVGGAYLAFEATEKILEKLLHEHEHEEQLVDAMADPVELEKMQVKGAIRTDFILSAEIMAIALASLEHLTLTTTAIALVIVAIAITLGVYGVVALIVKLDDIGLHMSERRNRATRAFGAALVRIVPKLLTGLAAIGTAAMLLVGGGILVHGLEETGIAVFVPHTIHDVADRMGAAVGVLPGLIGWIVTALGGAVVGLVIGGIIVLIVRRFTKHPEELIVD